VLLLLARDRVAGTASGAFPVACSLKAPLTRLLFLDLTFERQFLDLGQGLAGHRVYLFGRRRVHEQARQHCRGSFIDISHAAV
jgi:hypothetical protein